MASMFQQPTEQKTKSVKKGRQSLPVYGGAGFSKHKAAIKRTNSQKDRFSNARKLFEKKVHDISSNSGNISLSSSNFVVSIGNNQSITSSSRQSLSSSVSSQGEAEETGSVSQDDKDVLNISNGSSDMFKQLVEGR